MLSIHLFFFSNYFVQVRVTMDPEPIYCIVRKGMTQQYTLDVTPLYCGAPCTRITKLAVGENQKTQRACFKLIRIYLIIIKFCHSAFHFHIILPHNHPTYVTKQTTKETAKFILGFNLIKFSSTQIVKISKLVH